MRASPFVWLVALVLVVAGCQSVPAPKEDYALARAALEAARSVQAARHSPGYWHQAEEAYRKARILYHERDWEGARREFVRARVAAERAENSARLIRQKTGDIL